jgi:O-antigen/teichoic acid export membrane protein
MLGPEYQSALGLLRITLLCSLPAAAYSMFTSVQTARMKVRSIAILNLIRGISIILMSYVLTTRFGLIGLGYAWAITYLLLSIMMIIIAKRENLI